MTGFEQRQIARVAATSRASISRQRPDVVRRTPPRGRSRRRRPGRHRRWRRPGPPGPPRPSRIAAVSASRSSVLIALSLAGRLRVRRTPQRVGSRRTSGSIGRLVGSAIGPPPGEDDEGIDGDRAAGMAMTGLRSTSSDVRWATDAPARDGDDELGQGGRSTARPARGHRPGSARTAQLVEHREGVRAVDGRQADRDIVEDLGQDAAEADDDRPARTSGRARARR